MIEFKHALITGASSGIGLELAKVFAENGFNLIIVGRDLHSLNSVAVEISRSHGIRVETIAKDLFEQQNAFAVYEEVQRLGIKIDVLVNNAAQGLFGEFIETDLRKELGLLQLNIGAYVILTKLFLKEMVARGDGRILNVASIAGKIPGPYQAVYHGTKAFIHSFTESIRAELKDSGISVTSLLPGATDTDFFRKANMENSRILDQELSDPADVARAGYKALMDGDDMVVPGAKWKAQIIGSHFMTDSALANLSLKQQGPRSS